MNTFENDYSTICRQAITKFGLETQTRQLMEECGELIRAANHFLRSEGKDHDIAENYIEEIADVFIMINQFCCYFHWTDAVNEVVVTKMLRLSAKLESINKEVQP